MAKSEDTVGEANELWREWVIGISDGVVVLEKYEEMILDIGDGDETVALLLEPTAKGVRNAYEE